MSQVYNGRSGQSQYPGTMPNDVLEELVDNFEKHWKQHRRAVSSTEITNVQTAISNILNNLNSSRIA
jgi:hypothetical protein